MRPDAVPGSGVVACALILVAAACNGPSAGRVPMRTASLEAFAADVEPHIEVRCAQGGCHGRPERPLSLYAPGQQRLDPDRLYMDEPLTDEEVAENARRILAFAQEPEADRTLALRKPLTEEAGGCWHGGGDIFPDTFDPAYLALRSWLADARVADGGLP